MWGGGVPTSRHQTQLQEWRRHSHDSCFSAVGAGSYLVDAVKDDHYYCFLVPLTIPVTVIAGAAVPYSVPHPCAHAGAAGAAAAAASADAVAVA